MQEQWMDIIGSEYVIQQQEVITVSQECMMELEEYKIELRGLMHSNTPADRARKKWLMDKISEHETSDLCTVITMVDTYVLVNGGQGEPNDGFILESEQTTGNADFEYQNVAVNHYEVLNHPEMMSNFNDIWVNGGYFITAER